jgi:hypothetical protein
MGHLPMVVMQYVKGTSLRLDQVKERGRAYASPGNNGRSSKTCIEALAG